MDTNLVKEEVQVNETLIKVEEPSSSPCSSDNFFDNPLITPIKKDNKQDTLSDVETSQEEEDADSSPGKTSTTRSKPRKQKLRYPAGLHKRINKPKKISVKFVNCDECGDSIPAQPYFLISHQRKHGKGFPCSHCSAEFTASPYLIDHGKRMHADILQKLRSEATCSTCKYIGRSKEDLERHARIMHGIGKVHIPKSFRAKPKCGTCTELANSLDLDAVAEHKKWHQNRQKPVPYDESTRYKCPYCHVGHDGEFRSYKKMLDHTRHTHPEEGRLGGIKNRFKDVCPFCRIQCQTRDSLSRHCRARHADREITWDQNGRVVVDRVATSESDDEMSEGDGEIESGIGQGQQLEVNAMMTEDDPLKWLRWRQRLQAKLFLAFISIKIQMLVIRTLCPTETCFHTKTQRNKSTPPKQFRSLTLGKLLGKCKNP